MPRVRETLQPAYLLKASPYRETSQLLEVMTQAHGRVGLVARGVRGRRGVMRGTLQPFRPLLLSWTELGALGTLTDADSQGASPVLDGPSVLIGWYLNELLLRLTARHDAHPELFDLYEQTLAAIARNRFDEAALRRFELGLLRTIGYGLPWPELLDENACFSYHPEEGFRPALSGDLDSYRGASLIALHNEALETTEHLRDARRLLREALNHQLGGRELQSRRLMRAVYRRAERPERPT